MSVEISGLNNANMQLWASKCDVNKDGKIDGDELSIFNQGKKTLKMQDNNLLVNIDGVGLNVGQLETIGKNAKGSKFDNFVKFTCGVEMEYDKQSKYNEASIGAHFANEKTSCKGRYDVFAMSYNLKDGDGCSIKGTQKNDDFLIYNSKIGNLDAKGGKDYVSAYGSTVSADGNVSNVEYNDDRLKKETKKEPNKTASDKKQVEIKKEEPEMVSWDLGFGDTLLDNDKKAKTKKDENKQEEQTVSWPFSFDTKSSSNKPKTEPNVIQMTEWTL